MKKFLLASVAFAAIAGPAMAADMPVAPPPPPVVYYDWTGAYIGFNAGGAWYDVNRHFTGTGGGFLPSADVSTNDSDGIFGFHAGAQWQWGAWVVGAEAALSGCFRECRSTSAVNTSPIFGPTQFAEHKITNLFTVGPRLGYAWDRLMIFATGGWASANLKGSFCSNVTNICDGPGSGGNGASRNNGWYAGGGFDYMVHKGPLVDILLGLEYQHFDVGGKNAFCANSGCLVQTAADYDLSAKGDIVRARLTIKTQGYGFWGTAPGPMY
jgi:outer membrane immunogenic protein